MKAIMEDIIVAALISLVVIGYHLLESFGFDIVLFLIFLVLAILLLDELWYCIIHKGDDCKKYDDEYDDSL